MIVVIQCASSKQPDAPTLLGSDGRRVIFVARPDLAPPDPHAGWAHPDAPSDTPGCTWRALVERENAAQPSGGRLFPAGELYLPPVYRLLMQTFGVGRVRILSAGWGLVRAGFRLPAYDITFSPRAEPYKRRRAQDHYSDFVQVDVDADGPLVFLGGVDYLPLFDRLTAGVKATIIVPFRCDPADAGAALHRAGAWLRVPFRTATKTNWHYECARRLCEDPTSFALLCREDA